MDVFHVLKIVQMVPNRAKHLMRKDRNIFGGSLTLYINWDIPSKQIRTKLLKALEPIFIENFLSGFSFTNIRDWRDNKEEGKALFLNLLYHFHSFRRHLDISRQNTEGGHLCT